MSRSLWNVGTWTLESLCWGAGSVTPADGNGSQDAVRLPPGVEAVWDPQSAYRETTPTRERICINGLWQWQPAERRTHVVPQGKWGYFKVPGSWPGITDYMQKDCQTVYLHTDWEDVRLRDLIAAWYQREISIPLAWTGRRIALTAEYLNSFAIVYKEGPT